jgi:hypothetical protein
VSSRWLLLFVATSFAHAALSLPALGLIAGLLDCAETLPVVIALMLFFPCFLLSELGALGWEPALEGPLEVMIPLNSLLWSLVVVSLAFAIRRLVTLFALWLCRDESSIPPSDRLKVGEDLATNSI